MKIITTQEDFDNAVKQWWSSGTCLLAQTSRRLKLNTDGYVIPGSDQPTGYLYPFNNKTAKNLYGTFDKYFNNPGDEKGPELVALRNSLPIELGDFDENQTV